MKQLKILIVLFFISQTLFGQEKQVYTSIEAALKKPEKVFVLLLEGQELNALPDSMILFIK